MMEAQMTGNPYLHPDFRTLDSPALRRAGQQYQEALRLLRSQDKMRAALMRRYLRDAREAIAEELTRREEDGQPADTPT